MKEGGEMAVDWLRIKSEYVNGNISYRQLSEKHGIPLRTIAKHAKEEEWQSEKERCCNAVASSLQQKTVEKISDALSDEAAAKVRIKASMMRLAEGWFAKQERIIAESPQENVVDPNEFRKMVQSCVDLGIMEVQEGADIEDDGLLAALGDSASGLFDGDDDSAMLPEEGGK